MKGRELLAVYDISFFYSQEIRAREKERSIHTNIHIHEKLLSIIVREKSAIG